MILLGEETDLPSACVYPKGTSSFLSPAAQPAARILWPLGDHHRSRRMNPISFGKAPLVDP